jgi:hypothetical protein
MKNLNGVKKVDKIKKHLISEDIINEAGLEYKIVLKN